MYIKILCEVCKVLTGAGLARKTLNKNQFSSTLTHPTVTCTTIPIFNSVSKSFKTFPSLVMKQKGDQDFRHIITLTFFSATNLIEFGNTEMWFILLPH